MPPRGHGPHKTLYNRFIRWSRLGVFARIFTALAAEGGVPERLMIDSTHLKAQLLADRGYDSDRFRAGLLKRGIEPCIPPVKGRKAALPLTTRSCIDSAAASRMPSAAWRTGVASRLATTAAPTPSSRPYASQQPSPSGCHSES